MNVVEQLCVALGLAGLAGINLYLTVFATGLAIRFHWIDLAAQYEQLRVLGETPVLVIAGTLYALEFFADKVPWIDSLWDSIHTVIRPIGGALLAVQVLGQPEPVFDVITALLAGSTALATHTAKAGTRLVVNSSPEPFSNIALSVAEDAVVLGGVWLVNAHPYLTGALVLLTAGLVAWLAPKLFRSIRVRLWLGWQKLRAPADNEPLAGPLPSQLPSGADLLFQKIRSPNEHIVWAVPCISGGGKRIPRNLFGWLIATDRSLRSLAFVGRSVFTRATEILDLEHYKAVLEPGFLSESIVLYSTEQRPRYTFLFGRSQRAMAKRVAQEMQTRLETPAPGEPDQPLLQSPHNTAQPLTNTEAGTANN